MTIIGTGFKSCFLELRLMKPTCEIPMIDPEPQTYQTLKARQFVQNLAVEGL